MERAILPSPALVSRSNSDRVTVLMVSTWARHTTCVLQKEALLPRPRLEIGLDLLARRRPTTPSKLLLSSRDRRLADECCEFLTSRSTDKTRLAASDTLTKSSMSGSVTGTSLLPFSVSWLSASMV